MAFDGLLTRGICIELGRALKDGRISKIYQPESGELLLHVHTRSGNAKLLLSAASAGARVLLSKGETENPAEPPAFCMLLRKQLIGGRIADVRQRETERIVEIVVECNDELGFPTPKCLYTEIMGKHSNIVLCDLKSGRIADSIKRVSFDLNRPRQLLPGLIYEYPPAQDKIPFDGADEALFSELAESAAGLGEEGAGGEQLAKRILSRIQGLSPALASEIAYCAVKAEPKRRAEAISKKIGEWRAELEAAAEGKNKLGSYVYSDDTGRAVDFHIFPLTELAEVCECRHFDSISEGAEFFFSKRDATNRLKQAKSASGKSLSAALDKLCLKKQRMSEDILKAKNAEVYRLYGELITANLYKIAQGGESCRVPNYYDGSEIEIPLDRRYSAAKNAQLYFKKYAKAKTTVKEKSALLEAAEKEIEYLISLQALLEAADDMASVEAVRRELTEEGYVRNRGKKQKEKKKKAGQNPLKYTLSGGYTLLVGRSNTENDYLTFKLAKKTDLWFHTKDIPGSHAVLLTGGKGAAELPEELIHEAAAVAAYHSKGRNSENVPVDYTAARHVKKPNGAKPGMVIFTDNRTVWVNPEIPTAEKSGK